MRCCVLYSTVFRITSTVLPCFVVHCSLSTQVTVVYGALHCSDCSHFHGAVANRRLLLLIRRYMAMNTPCEAPRWIGQRSDEAAVDAVRTPLRDTSLVSCHWYFHGQPARPDTMSKIAQTSVAAAHPSSKTRVLSLQCSRVYNVLMSSG